MIFGKDRLARQITEAFPWTSAPAYLVRDNDRAYGHVFTSRVGQSMAQASDPHSHEWLLDALTSVGLGVPAHPKPLPEAPPDFQADLVRPDDLLTLHVAGYNLKVAPSKDGPNLELIDAAKDALIVVTFPPQNVAETAYFQTTNIPLPPLPPGIPPAPPGFPPPGSPPLPGQTGARLSGFTRLVFRLAAEAKIPAIPYSIE